MKGRSVALDNCHKQVVNALIKAGWIVDTTAYFLEHDETVIYPDIRAHLANGKTQDIIVVEVKCFSDKSAYQNEFYRAVGQYLFYRTIMILKQIPGKLYLSVPITVYESYFVTDSVAETIKSSQISLVIVDIEREEIVQWLD
jgi:hypothetical protein